MRWFKRQIDFAGSLKVMSDKAKLENADKNIAELKEWNDLAGRLFNALPDTASFRYAILGSSRLSNFRAAVEYFENEKLISAAVERCQKQTAAQNNKNRRKEKH